MSFAEMKFEDMSYLVQYPKDYKEGEKHPVVVFVHGAGTRHPNCEKLKEHPFVVTKNQLHEKAILYVPLCSADTWFDIFEQLRRFAGYVSQREDTDRDRFCLMGASMGGYAVWQMAMSDPELYAGIVPICGGGMYWNAGRLKDIDVWAFHGRKDCVVYCEESIRMVEHINAAGGKAKLTLLEEYAHNAWDYVFGDEAVMQWLLSCRRGKREAAGSRYDSPEIFG